jgi:hypothetical protein
MKEHTGQNVPDFRNARGTSEQRPEPERSPSPDETTKDGQDVSTGIAQVLNEGGNGGMPAPGTVNLRGAVAGSSASDFEWAPSR